LADILPGEPQANENERAFTQEAFDFIGATNHLAVFEQAPHLEVITI
jgi:hypothetical protein